MSGAPSETGPQGQAREERIHLHKGTAPSCALLRPSRVRANAYIIYGTSLYPLYALEAGRRTTTQGAICQHQIPIVLRSTFYVLRSTFYAAPRRRRAPTPLLSPTSGDSALIRSRNGAHSSPLRVFEALR